jgi:DMSO/TMAO reductase YedYZ molybdopterin-dependent catalytic subunit
MERLKTVLVIVVIAAILTGIVLFVVMGGEPAKEEVEVAGGQSAEVTPTESMRVRTAEGEPEIDLETYRLNVTGLVEKEISLSFDQLKAMEADERLVELPCVEGWSEEAFWKGPRLSRVLEVSGIRDGVETVVFSSPGGYTTSLTMADIREVDPLLAYEVNGERLPDEQGYPLRMVVPDRLGYKWIKWVDGIELVAGDYEGYWESRGYSNQAEVK